MSLELDWFIETAQKQVPFELHLGDCRKILRREYEENSIDSVVMDPPAGISFMGKEWDSDKGGRDNWIEWMYRRARAVYRVLKPGGHALVWALPRTSHWTATAFEDAGFEIRDRVSHLFGTGFPKSYDVSKGIDKMNGVEFKAEPASGCGFMRPDGRGGYNVTKNKLTRSGESSPEAEYWQGYGTALKPACEDWWLLRKPLSEKSVAANVLKWGVGALNIDGCRIGNEVVPSIKPKAQKNGKVYGTFNGGETTFNKGRFPSHVILDEEAARLLDRQSGVSKSNVRISEGRDKPGVTYSLGRKGTTPRGHADSGGASRFFYIAKPTGKEKDRGLDAFEERLWVQWATHNNTSGVASSWSEKRNTKRRNTHPTVKSVTLMRYLCRLITPPGGTVLDAFMGSGSTGVAALLEGFRFVGIDSWDEAFAIANARIRYEYEQLTHGSKTR